MAIFDSELRKDVIYRWNHLNVRDDIVSEPRLEVCELRPGDSWWTDLMFWYIFTYNVQISTTKLHIILKQAWNHSKTMASVALLLASASWRLSDVWKNGPLVYNEVKSKNVVTYKTILSHNPPCRTRSYIAHGWPCALAAAPVQLLQDLQLNK